MKARVRFGLVVLGAVLAAGCGQEPAEAPPAQVQGVSGSVSKGPLQGATVDFYAVDVAGSLSGPALVASVTTDASGGFGPVTGLPAGVPILVRTSGGSYVDESDPETNPALRRQITFAAGEHLEAVLSPGQTTLAITPYSMAMYKKAVQQAAGSNFPNVYAAVRAQATGAFGFDPISTIPADPITGAGGSQQYAILLGAAALEINRIAVTGTPEHLPGHADVIAFVNDFANGRLKDGPGDPAEPADAPSLDDLVRRFRNNNIGVYSAIAPPDVDEAALSEFAQTLPQISAIADLAIPESTTTGAIAFTIADNETPPALLTLSSNSSNTTLVPIASIVFGGSGSSRTVTVTPAAGQSGSATITVTVTDTDGDSAAEAFVLTVNSVNTPPVINSTASTTAIEDTLYTYNATVNDPDGPAPTWSLGASHTCGGSIVPATGAFTFTPAGPVPSASCVVQVQVTDGGTPVTQSTTVTITAVNDLPVINSTAPATATEDTLYTYNATRTDADGPSTTWSLSPGNTCTGASIVPATGVYTFTPTGPTPPASCTVGVQVSDGGTPVVQNTSISITAVNDLPVINSAAPATATEDTLYTYNATRTDADGPSTTWSLSPGNTCASASIVPATGVYTFTPTGPAPPANCTVGVQVSDGGTPVVQNTSISITAVNDLPVINSTALTTATEDTLYTYNATVTDPDGPAPTWSLGASHTCGGSIVPASGIFTFTPTGPTPPASCVVQVQVTDGGTPVTQNTTVTITAVNDLPVINSTASTTATEDTLYTYNATVTDPDGAVPTWSLGASHTCGGSIVPASGAFTFTPTGPVPPASCVVQVQVTDGGTPVTQNTTVTITAVNDAPTANNDSISVAEGGSATTLVGGATSVLANDTDPENDALTAILVSGPANAATFLLNADGTFTYLHNNSETTTDSFTYKANDGGLDSNNATVTISITPVNDLPVINSTAPTAATEDTLLTYNATVTDPDGPAPAWSLGASNTCGGFIDPASGVFTFTPNGPVPLPSCELQVQVTDGGTPVTQSTTVTITAVNDAPVAVDDVVTTDEDVAASIDDSTLLANDFDGESDVLAVVAVSNWTNGLPVLAGNTVTFTPDPDFNGTATFDYSISDNNGGADTALVTVTVNPINDAPSFTVPASAPAVNQDDPPQTVTGFATAISAGPANESGQVVSFTISGNTNPTLFSASPAISSSGDLTYTPAAGQSGSATIDVVAIDDGGIASGGVDTSGPQSFTITVNATVADGTAWLPYRTHTGALGLIDPRQGLAFATFPDSGVGEHNDANPNNYRTLFGADISAGNATNIRHVRTAYVKGGQLFVVNLDTGAAQTPVATSVTDACGIIEMGEDFANPDNTALFVQTENGDGCDNGNDLPKAVLGLTPSATVVAAPNLQEIKALHDPATGAVTGYLAMFGTSRSDGTTLNRCDTLFNCGTVLVNLHAGGGNFNFIEEKGQTLFYLAFRDSDDPATRLYRYDVALNDFNPSLTAPSPIHQFTSSTHNGGYDGSHFYFPDGNALFRVLHTAPTSQLVATAADTIEDVDLTTNRAVIETRGAGGVGNVYSVPKSGGSFIQLFGRALVANESAQLAYVDAGGRVFMDAITQSGGTITAESAAQALEDGSGFSELADATWAGGTRATSFNLENMEDLPAQTLLRAVHFETSPTSSDDTLEVVNPATGLVTHTPGLLSPLVRFDGINGDGVGRYMAIEATWSGDGLQDAHLIDTQAGGVQVISSNAGENNWVFFEDVGEDGGGGPSGPVSPPSGMLAWYRAEGNADDIQGLHHGTLFGPTFVSGQVGVAFTFDGVDDRVELGSWFNFQTFSIEMWVNEGASQVAFADIIDNRHSNGINWVLQYQNVGHQYSFGTAIPAGNVFFDLTPGVWQHVAITYEATEARVYLNGALVDSAANPGPVVYDGNQFVRLGDHWLGGRAWNGQLDEVSFYDRVLSPGEVQSIFNANNFGKLQLDTDADGLLNSAELELFFTDPGNPDSDGDTFNDGNEVGAGSDPNNFNDRPGNDAPVVMVNAGLTLGEGATTLISTSELSAIDGDHAPSDLTYNFGPGPSHGAILVNSIPASFFTQFDLDIGFVSYMHDGTETASDSFDFAVTDTGGPPLSSPVETFNITVTLANDAPVANADSYSMDADTTLVVDAADDPTPPLGLLFNDTDEEDGTPGTALNVTTLVCLPDPAPATCTLDSFSADGSFSFTPPAGFTGTMTFQYDARDSGSSVSSAPALVTVSVGAAGSLLPLRDGNGALQLFDPSQPLSAGTNPFEVDNSLPLADFSGTTAFTAMIDSGTSTFSNIGLARFAYIKGGLVFKVDLRPGFPNNPVQISSIADACRIQGVGEDFADPDNTPVMIERAGPDTDCTNQSDNFRTFIRLNMTPGDPGQSPAGLNNVELLRDAGGATLGYLTVEGGAVFRRDSEFSAPTQLITLDGGNSSFSSAEKGQSLEYLVFQETGQSTRGLYRYDTAGAGTLSARLYGFTSAQPDDSDSLFTYDGADLFFVDGADVLKIAHGGATVVPVASSTVGDVNGIKLTGNRVVFEAGSPGNSSIYSVNKDGTGFVTLFNTANAGEQASLSAVEPGGWVFFTVSGPSGLNANRVRDTGSSPASIGNAYWAGATFPTNLVNNEANDFENVIGTLVLGTKGAGFDTLEAYDPATGSATGTLGSINGTPPLGETVFGGGVGNTFAVAAIVDHAGLIDVDAWIADTQALTLTEVSSVVGADDLWGLFTEGGGEGGGGAADSDGDGLDDGQEAGLGTNPNNPDTDGDGFTDFTEVTQDGNPNDYNPGLGDSDPNDFGSVPGGAPFQGKLHQGVFDALTSTTQVELSWPVTGGHAYRICATTDPATNVDNCLGTAGNQEFGGLTTSPFPVTGLAPGVPVYFSLQDETLGNQLVAWTAARPNVWGFDNSVNAIAISADGTRYVGGAFSQASVISGSGVTLNSAIGGSPGHALAFPEVRGQINAAAPDGQGGWYVGGLFTSVGGQPRQNLAQVDAQGGVTPWDPGANNEVFALTVDAGVIYAGGDFSNAGAGTTGGTGGAGMARSRLAAFEPAGSIRGAWDPGADSSVLALVANAGVIYAGGSFSNAGGGGTGTTARNNLAAFDSAGTLAAWNPGTNSGVNALAVDGGVIYAGGFFSGAGGGTGTTTRISLAAFTTAGGLTTWNPGTNGSVNALAVNAGVIYAGGGFTTAGGQPRSNVAALNNTNGAATSWNPGADNGVNAIMADGGVIYAGGAFTFAGGGGTGTTARNNLAAFNADSTGTLTAWNPGAGNEVYALAASAGVIYAGGLFTSVGAQARDHLAAFDPSGNLTAWNPGTNGSTVRALAVNSGVIYAGGNFTTAGGSPRAGVAAFDTSGVLTSWDPGITGTVITLAVDAGVIYAGGNFNGATSAGTGTTGGGGQARSFLAAIDTAGLLLPWNPVTNSVVNALAVNASVIYAGGNFTTASAASGQTGGSLQSRGHLAAFDTSGALLGWAPTGAAQGVNTLVVDSGLIYTGGNSTNTSTRLAAFDVAGTQTSWNPASNGTVNAIAVDAGVIYASGNFTNVGGQPRNFLAALNDTTGDATSWNPGVSASVAAFAVNAGVIHVGGGFTQAGTPTQLRNRLAAFDVGGVLVAGPDLAGDPDGDGLTTAQEYAALTDPDNPDTDGDGIPDGTDPDPLNAANVAPAFDQSPSAPFGVAINRNSGIGPYELTDANDPSGANLYQVTLTLSGSLDTLDALHGALFVRDDVPGGVTPGQILMNNTAIVTINADLASINTTLQSFSVAINEFDGLNFLAPLAPFSGVQRLDVTVDDLLAGGQAAQGVDLAVRRVELADSDADSYLTRFDGDVVGDALGVRTSGSAGDFNGDGQPDIVTSGSFASPLGRTLAGQVYVVFGGAFDTPAGGSLDPFSLASDFDGSNGFVIYGASLNDQLGTGYTLAGDFDRDGWDDLVVGAGRAFVGGTRNGRVYMIFGGQSIPGGVLDLANPDPSVRVLVFDGLATGDRLGRAEYAGDLNRDGFMDLMMAAPTAAPGGRQHAGQAYVVFGAPFGTLSPECSSGMCFYQTNDPTPINRLTQLDGNSGFTVNGIFGDGTDSGAPDFLLTGDQIGYSIAPLGDFNGDHVDDVMLGSATADPDGGRTNGGQAYVIFGRTTGVPWPATIELSSLAGIGITINGENAETLQSGGGAGPVAAAGDADGDGKGDLLIGYPGGSGAGRTESGIAYIVYGSAAAPPIIELSDVGSSVPGFRLLGAGAGDRVGGRVRKAGDVNRDGIDDLLVAAPGRDPNGRAEAGGVYLIYGKAGGYTSAIDLASNDGRIGVVYNGANPGDFADGGLGTTGDLDGDGYDDFSIGGSQPDLTAGGGPPAGTGIVYAAFGADLRRVVDTDGDGLSDAYEVYFGTNPLAPDSDADGLNDGLELRVLHTNPQNADSDGDGLSDPSELAVGDPNAYEPGYDTDPTNPDTDGDGINDGGDPNPLLAITAFDTDGDGVSDNIEGFLGSNAAVPNSVVVFVSAQYGNDANSGINWGQAVQSSAAAVTLLDAQAPYPSTSADTYWVLYDQTTGSGRPGPLFLADGTARSHAAFVGGLGPGVNEPDDTRTALEGGGPGRVVEVSNGTNVTLGALELRFGSGVPIGGGLYVHDTLGAATVQLVGSTVRNNVANDGGGVAVTGVGASLFVQDSEIHNNTAQGSSTDGRGGGLLIDNQGALTLQKTRVRSNTAQGTVTTVQRGGGLHAGTGTSISIDEATFADNLAINGPGGGVNLVGALSASIQNSLFLSNESLRPGAGLHIHPSGPTAVFNNLFVGNVTTDGVTQADGGAVELDVADPNQMGVHVLDFNSNSVAYNQVRGFSGNVGGGLSVKTSVSAPFPEIGLRNNLVWHNQNGSPASAEAGDNFLWDGIVLINGGGNNINEAPLLGATNSGAAGIPDDPLFPLGFYLNQLTASVDGGDDSFSNVYGSSQFSSTDTSYAPDTGTVDIGFHHQDGADGTLMGVRPQSTSVVCGAQTIVFTPQWQFGGDDASGHLIVVQLSPIGSVTLGSRTTFDLQGAGSRIARDLGDGNYAVNVTGFGDGTGTFSVYADDQPVPQTFQRTFTSAC